MTTGTDRFVPGDRVRTRATDPAGHTRLPRYARGAVGGVGGARGPAGPFHEPAPRWAGVRRPRGAPEGVGGAGPPPHPGR